jgi:hypothetical protein
MRTQFKFFLVSVFLCISISLNAQTEKGRLIYGGTIYANTTATGNGYVNMGIQPQVGGFILKNFAILGLLHLSVGYNNLVQYGYGASIGAGPELRYYAGSEKVKFCLHGNALPLFTGSSFAMQGGGGPGVAIFPNSNISINTSLFVGAYRPTFQHSYPATVLISFTTVINGLFGGKPKV